MVKKAKDKKKTKKKGDNYQHLGTTKERIVNRHKMLKSI